MVSEQGRERAARATIAVSGGPDRFTVRVDDGHAQTEHRVAVSPEEASRFAPAGVPLERLVEESFRFLLEREPAQSILAEFSLSTIERYFPEYGVEIRKRLGGG